MQRTLIHSGTLVSAHDKEKVDILIEDGIIKSIANPDTENEPQDNIEVIDATDLLVFPGMIDSHVHFREPGFPHKATMASEAESARAGGVTTVCEMPNTNPPTTTVEAFRDKVQRADAVEGLDLRFYFLVTQEEHLDELRTLWTSQDPEIQHLKSRCPGLKLFLENSTGNQKAEGAVVEQAFALCGELGIPLAAHCEDAEMNAAAEAARTSDAIEQHSIVRPAESEAKAIEYAINLAKKCGTQFHVVHLSTALGLDLVRQAKADGLPVTTEVCPHHLFLSTEDYGSLGTHCKMNPPVRAIENTEALWGGLADGVIDAITTDHAPHTGEEKANEQPLEAPSGVPGVETKLPLLLSVIADQWSHPLSSDCSCKLQYTDLVRLCFDAPNQIFSLDKEGVTEGAPADLVLVDPTVEWTISANNQHSQCDWTPYEGWEVVGRVERLIG